MVILLFLLALVDPAGQQQSPQTAVVRGRVVASDTGAPVRSATGRLAGGGALGTFLFITDLEGRFEIRDIPAGQFSLQISKSGFSTTFFGPTGRTAAPFEIKAGLEITFPDLRLPRAGVIVGRVADELNDPIADITVTAWRVQYFEPAQRRVSSFKSFQTNDLGEFRLYGLPPGKYYVSASRQVVQISTGAKGVEATTFGGVTEAPTFFPGTAVTSDALAVEVKVGEDTLGTNFQYRQSSYGRVTGTVVDSKGRPYDDAGVWLVPARSDGALISTRSLIGLADKQGRFTIIDVSPGDYRAEVFSRSWMEKLGAGTAGMSPTGEVGYVAVTVTAGRTEELSIRSTTGFRVAGRMLLDGMPVTTPGKLSATATASVDSGGFSGLSAPRTSAVSTDGSFVLEGIHGPRIIRASGLPAGTYLHHVMLRGQDVTDQGFDVSRGDIDGVEIHLTTKPAVLEGEVRSVTGAPISAARVLVFAQNRQDWLWFFSRRYSQVTANAEGKFRVAGMPAGSYLAAVLKDDDRDRAGDPDFIDSLRILATPFTLNDGATTTVVVQVKK